MYNNIIIPFMETIISTPAKKQWQKPQIYLLDSNNIEGGGANISVEVQTPNHSHAKNGAITTTFPSSRFVDYHS